MKDPFKETPKEPSDAPVELSEAQKRARANLRKPWPKGKSGNPSGKQDPVKRAIARMTNDELKDVMNAVLKQDRAHLKMLYKSHDTSVIQAMVIRVALKVLNTGDPAALDLLLNRLIGKVPNPVELSTPPEKPFTVSAETREERLKRIAQLNAVLTETDA